MPNHYCKCCRGERPNDGIVCLGCGTALQKCQQKRPVQSHLNCPGCSHDGPHKTIESGRYRCMKCTAVFEGPDFGYLDDRPEINAEKQEQMARDRRKKGAYRR